VSDFEFHNEWRIAADPDAVYAALADVVAYPSWWPQVKSAKWLSDGFGELRCRATLPYDLKFRARWVVEDPERRELKAELQGDLIGTSSWTVRPDREVTVAVFDEAVNVRNRLMRLAAAVGKPALRRNQDAMMRGGEKGLQALLAT
jgi:ribosome-associated toxin RatA of RatAB toxin-antitoxin module